MQKTTYQNQYRFSSFNHKTRKIINFFECPITHKVLQKDDLTLVYIKLIDINNLKHQYRFYIRTTNYANFAETNKVKRCDNCGDITNIREKFGGLDYCAFCVDSCVFECQDCHFKTLNTSSHERLYCADCRAKRGIVECDNCQLPLGGDEVFSFNGNDYCANCISDDSCFSTVNPNPSIQYPSIKPGKIVKHHRLVGCEIELEGGEVRNDHWLTPGTGIVHDGSLNDSGREFITPPAASTELEKIIHGVCDKAKEYGFRSSNRCGLHIHVDGRDFKLDPFTAYKLVRTYQHTEIGLLSMLPMSRSGNHYCDHVYNRVNLDEIYPTMTLDEFIVNYYSHSDPDYIKSACWKEKYNSARYCGLNLHSLYYRGTVEIRYYKGTKNAEEILNWVQLNLAIIEWAINSFNEVKLKKIDLLPQKDQLEATCRLVKTTKANREFVLAIKSNLS